MKDELISVIIPIYNVERYLSDCLESIIRQTHSHLEIIAVNDGSTDGCNEILRRYTQKDHRIRVINQTNRGVSAARNAGMATATGKYLAFVDSDDYIESNMLELMLRRMLASGADVVECGYHEVMVHDTSVHAVPFPKSYDEISGTENILEYHVKGSVSLLVWNKLYKTEKVKQIAFIEGKKYEDVLWSTQALLNTHKICSIPECLYYWRQRSGSTTNSSPTASRLVALEHFDQRIGLLNAYPNIALIAKGRIVCECYLECKVMNETGDIGLMEATRLHSKKYRKLHRLSLLEIIRLRSPKEIIRYFYYSAKFLWEQLRFVGAMHPGNDL